MEEERLKDIFKEYEPALSSRLAFMERLERNLKAVEIIHQANARAVRRNKIALLFASVAGFVASFIFSHITPYIEKVTASLLESIPGDSLLNSMPGISNSNQIVSWIIIGAVSVFTSIGTYNMLLNYRPLTDVRRED